jgi:hypothetical protein
MPIWARYVLTGLGGFIAGGIAFGAEVADILVGIAAVIEIMGHYGIGPRHHHHAHHAIVAKGVSKGSIHKWS